MSKQVLTAEIKQQIRKMRLLTNRMIQSMAQGEQKTRKHGPGFLFDQLRDYYPGDDIRYIDWNSSARMNALLVKQYQEERNKQVLLVVDISSSHLFGHAHYIKSDSTHLIATLCTWVAHYEHSNVGLVLFHDKIERYIPMGSGLSHVQRVLDALFTHSGDHKGTNINSVLEFLPMHIKRDAMVIFISDFIDTQLDQRMLTKIGTRYDAIAVRCVDTHEIKLPSCGFLTIQDIETQQSCVIDTRKKAVKRLNEQLAIRMQDQATVLKRSRMHLLDIKSDEAVIQRLVRFFYNRLRSS